MLRSGDAFFDQSSIDHSGHPPAFRFLARGKVNAGASNARARPKLSIASLPARSTVIGWMNRFTVVPFRPPMRFCRKLSLASFRFTDATVIPILLGPDFLRKIRVLTRATLSL